MKLNVGQGATHIPRIAQLDPLGRWQESQKELLCLHANQIHIEPRQRLVANITEHIVVDDEIVNQTLEKRVVENEQRLRQVAYCALGDDRCVIVTEDGQQCPWVVVIAVPNIVKLVAGRTQHMDMLGSKLTK